ncbi:site-specific integrase, partial [Synergistaceae bacterium OttesenSCG-928-D05]|nr:site-specific integrase [Synergistaceae bacterium OttesenSCG-928-D05]
MIEAGINSYVDIFLDYLRSRGRAENTITNYAVDLNQFAEYLHKQGINDVGEITGDAIRGFLRDVMGFGFAKTSASRKLSAARGFVRWLTKKGYLEHNPAEELKGPKLPSSLPRALSYEDTERLLQ